MLWLMSLPISCWPSSCHFCTVLTHADCWIKVNWDIANKIYEHICYKSSSFYCNTQYYTTPRFNTTTEKDYSWQFLRRKFQKLTEINCTMQHSSYTSIHESLYGDCRLDNWLFEQNHNFWISPSVYGWHEEVSFHFIEFLMLKPSVT
jgi:hypothetical protein